MGSSEYNLAMPCRPGAGGGGGYTISIKIPYMRVSSFPSSLPISFTNYSEPMDLISSACFLVLHTSKPMIIMGSPVASPVMLDAGLDESSSSSA